MIRMMQRVIFSEAEDEGQTEEGEGKETVCCLVIKSQRSRVSYGDLVAID